MPRKNFKNIGELQGYEYLKGVVTAVDFDLDTCTLTIGEAGYSSVPIFYHCSDDEIELENGAIEGGSLGFAVDDEVLVLKQRDGLEDKIFVIGHVDGARHCAFQIKLIQDYEGVVGWPTGEDEFVTITIEDTDGNYYSAVYLRWDDLEGWTLNDAGTVWKYQPYLDDVGEDCQYNIVASYTIATQTWTLFWDGWLWEDQGAQPDPEAKYFIKGYCPDCPNYTQYPYRYKDADQGNVIDAVNVGAYDVVVPVFKFLEVVPSPFVTHESFSGNDCAVADELLEENPVRVIQTNTYFDYIRENAYEWSIKIKSSIPYTYMEGVILSGGLPSVLYTFDPGPEGDYGIRDNPGSAWTFGDVLQGGTRYCVDKDSSVDIAITGEIIDYSATPDTVGTSNLSESEVRSASGSGGRTHTIESEFTSNVRQVIDVYYYYPDYDPRYNMAVETTLPAGEDVGLKLTGRSPAGLAYCYASAIT